MSYNDLYLTISEQRRTERVEAARIRRLVADRRAAARTAFSQADAA